MLQSGAGAFALVLENHDRPPARVIAESSNPLSINLEENEKFFSGELANICYMSRMLNDDFVYAGTSLTLMEIDYGLRAPIIRYSWILVRYDTHLPVARTICCSVSIEEEDCRRCVCFMTGAKGTTTCVGLPERVQLPWTLTALGCDDNPTAADWIFPELRHVTDSGLRCLALVRDSRDYQRNP